MWIWKAETPASVPAGARISAGKSGSVARSLPKAALTEVNRSPVSCIPSPESPANRITTSGSCSVAFWIVARSAVSVIAGYPQSRSFDGRRRCGGPNSPAEQAGERPDRGDGTDGHHHEGPPRRGPLQVATIGLLGRPDQRQDVADDQCTADGKHQPREEVVAEEQAGTGRKHGRPAYCSSRGGDRPPRLVSRRGSRDRGPSSLANRRSWDAGAPAPSLLPLPQRGSRGR